MICRAAALLALAASSGCAGDGDGEAVGETSVAIVNGDVTTAYPAVGHLIVNDSWNCTATLIAPQIVVTATHCVFYTSASIRFETAGQSITADRWAWHGGYNSDPRNSAAGNAANIDIAVVHLQAPVKGVAPMKLATSKPKKSTPITIVGYGQAYAGEGNFSVKRAGSSAIGVVADDWFYADGRTWTCQGDSGGPAFVKENGELKIIGTFSRLRTDCSGGSSYMTTPLFAEWIDQQSKKF